MKKRVLLLLAIFLILPFISVNANSIKELQKQKNDIQKKIINKKNEIKKINKECDAVAQDISKLDREMDDANNKIASLLSDIKRLEKEIADNEILLDKTIKELDLNMEFFGKRLNAMQKTPEFSKLELLLSSENLNDYLTGKKFLTEIAEQDSKLIDNIKSEKKKVEETKFLLNKQRDYTLQKKDDLVRQREKLEQATRAKQDLMRNLTNDKKQLEASINAFNASANELTKKIRSLQKPASSKYVGGKLAWPLPGNERITSPFGMRVHPILKKKMMHTGIDIAASSGTAIRAAGAGTVIYAGWYASYGKVVMVDHGGGIVTLYAHCSSIAVGKGNQVKTGQKIASVGSTGRSTGPHLHFEVRKNGDFQNPINWVSK